MPTVCLSVSLCWFFPLSQGARKLTIAFETVTGSPSSSGVLDSTAAIVRLGREGISALSSPSFVSRHHAGSASMTVPSSLEKRRGSGTRRPLSATQSLSMDHLSITPPQPSPARLRATAPSSARQATPTAASSLSSSATSLVLRSSRRSTPRHQTQLSLFASTTPQARSQHDSWLLNDSSDSEASGSGLADRSRASTSEVSIVESITASKASLPLLPGSTAPAMSVLEALQSGRQSRASLRVNPTLEVEPFAVTSTPSTPRELSPALLHSGTIAEGAVESSVVPLAPSALQATACAQIPRVRAQAFLLVIFLHLACRCAGYRVRMLCYGCCTCRVVRGQALEQLTWAP